MQNRIKWALAGLGVLVLAVGLWLSPQAMAPDVQYVSIVGERSSQLALRGQVVLVNFWATSCTGCVAEMPKLIATHNTYQARGFKTVAVAMSYDPPEFVAAFTKQRQLPFFVALDIDGSIAKQFGDVALTPTSFLIDKRGRIVQRILGEPDFVALNALIEKKLAEPI